MRFCAVWDKCTQALSEAVHRASDGSVSQACLSPSTTAGTITKSAQSQPGQTPNERCVLEQLACVQLRRRATPYLLYLVRAVDHQAANTLLCRKQPTKARMAAAAQSQQQLTLVLMKCLPDLLMRFQADAVKVQHRAICNAGKHSACTQAHLALML